MKKINIIILATLLFVSAAFSAVGCDKINDKDKGGNDNVGNTDQYIVEYTDQYIVINGVSPYKIVIPEAADEATAFAGEEFKTLFQEATGAILPIVKDSQVQNGDKYISIGQTTQWKESGLTVSEELGISGSEFTQKTRINT